MEMERPNPLRIIHVLDSAEPEAGSAICRIVENLASGIDSSRYQIEACFLEPGRLTERLERLGIHSSCVHWNGRASDPLGAARYATLLRSSDFSIIHQHTGGRLLTSMGRILTRARTVRTLHSRGIESSGTDSPRCNLPQHDALIVVSQFLADFSGDSSAIVIHPGIDASLSAAKRIHEGIVIGAASRLVPIKGLNFLLDAVASVLHRFRDLRLEIAGAGCMQSSLEEQSRRLEISDHVSFLGWRDDLQAVMSHWDIFVLPSLDEGFPIAVMEAMAAGLPVVASAVGGVPELVQDGASGWLVPAATSDAIAMRLSDLLWNLPMRERMGLTGRQRIVREFPITRMVEQTVSVYDRILA